MGVSEFKVYALYTTRSVCDMHSTPLQIESVLHLPDCIFVDPEKGTWEETCRNGQKKM